MKLILNNYDFLLYFFSFFLFLLSVSESDSGADDADALDEFETVLFFSYIFKTILIKCSNLKTNNSKFTFNFND